MPRLTTVVADSHPTFPLVVSSTPSTWAPYRSSIVGGLSIPGTFGTPVLRGLALSSLFLQSDFLFSGLLDQLMYVAVVPHVTTVPQFYPHPFEESAD
ncbi:hypothetical protein Bca4012_020297 [Brassica carinata]